MKTFLTLLFSSLIFIVNAQVPKVISYQGIARSTSGTVLANQAIGVQFQIHQGSATGTIVFTETHSTTTNPFGLFNLSIGSANPTVFNAIDWSQSPYFIEVSIDPAGGTSYISVGTSPLISVPYALYAEKAGNATPVPTITINNPHTISNPTSGIYNVNVQSQTLTVNSNSLSISNGNTVTLPSGPTYTAGSGMDLTGNIITNTAPDQTVTITGTGVSGIYPNFTITPVSTPSTTLIQGQNVVLDQVGNTYTVNAVTPTLTVSGNSISINPGNTQVLPTYSLTQSGSNIDLTQNGASIATITLSASSSTSLTAGNANIALLQSGNNYTLSPVTPTLNVIGGTLTGAYPTQTLTIPTASTTALTASTNIAISGVAPNYTISSPSQSLSVTGNSLSITGANTVTIPATTVTAGNNVTVTGASPSYTVSAPNYVLGTASNSITLTNGVSSSSVAVPVQSLSLTGTTLTAGPTTNSVNLASLPGNWTVTSGVIYPTTVTNSVGIGTSGPLTDKMEINHASTPTNTHLHLKQTGADAFSRIKFSNAVAPSKYWINSVTESTTDANSGYNLFYYNGSVGRTMFTAAGDGRVSVNPFATHSATLDVVGKIELDSTLSFGGYNAPPVVSNLNEGRIYYDKATQKFKVSENSGAYVNLIGGSSPWIQGAGIITQTNSGDNVGIGTGAPTSQLHLYGVSDPLQVTVENGGGNFKTGYHIKTALNEWFIGQDGPSATGFRITDKDAAAVRLQIDQIGRVGIGTTSASEKLHVSGNIMLDSSLMVEGLATVPPTSFGGNGRIYFDQISGKFKVSENGSAWTNLISGQIWGYNPGVLYPLNNPINDKVAIGSSFANALLDVQAQAGSTITAMPLVNIENSNSALNTNGLLRILNNNGGAALIYAVNSHTTGDGLSVNMTNTSNGSNGVQVIHQGIGNAGYFSINNAASNASAIEANTNGNSPVINATQDGNGIGGKFLINNTSNSNAVVSARTNGTGPVILGEQFGTGRAADFRIFGNTNSSDVIFSQSAGLGNAGFFEVFNPSNGSNAISAHHYGTGAAVGAVSHGSGYAGLFSVVNNTNTAASLMVTTNSSGNAIESNAASGNAVYATNSSSTTAAGYFYNMGSYDGVGAYSNGGRSIYAQTSSSSGYSGIEGIHYGNGNGLLITKPAGSSGSVARFNNAASGNTSDAVLISNSGTGHGLLVTKPAGVTGGNVARFDNLSSSNSADAVMVTNNGTGAAIHAVSGPTVAGSSNAALWVENGHIKTTASAAPIIGSGGTNITGPTITRTLAAGVNSNDVSGSVSVNFSPATNIATGQYVEFRVTFQKPYSIKPKVIAVCQTYPFLVYVSGTSTTDCQIVIQNVGATVNSVSTITVNYMIME